MSKTNQIHPSLVNRLKQKASHSCCTFRISAIAFDKKGNILGSQTNKHSDWNVLKDNIGRPGTAKHAERLLMSRYAGVVKTIIICRISNNGKLRPIDACPACQKVAKKLGVNIISIKTNDCKST